MSYYLDIIYNKKTKDYDESDKKIKKTTNEYLNKLKNKKNRLKIIGDVQPMAPSNNQQPIIISDDKLKEFNNNNNQPLKLFNEVPSNYKSMIGEYHDSRNKIMIII